MVTGFSGGAAHFRPGINTMPIFYGSEFAVTVWNVVTAEVNAHGTGEIAHWISSRNGIMYHDSIRSGGVCTRLRIFGGVGRVALPTPTRFRDCPALNKRTSFRLPRHCEPHSGVAISWYCVCIRSLFQEIPTACGLGMTAVVGHSSIHFTRAIIQHGRRGQCHTPYGMNWESGYEQRTNRLGSSVVWYKG